MGWGKGMKKDPKKTYLGQNGGVALDHPRKCTARKHGGDPCRRFAIRGGTVCAVHGGSAPQVKAKAKRRMVEANDRATVRAIVERIRGNFTEGPDLALAPVDLADDLAEYAAEPELPAQPEVVDTPATELPDPADDSPAVSTPDGDPPGVNAADASESASAPPASTSGPSTPLVKPLMGLGEALAEGRRPPRPTTRGRRLR